MVICKRCGGLHPQWECHATEKQIAVYRASREPRIELVGSVVPNGPTSSTPYADVGQVKSGIASSRASKEPGPSTKPPSPKAAAPVPQLAASVAAPTSAAGSPVGKLEASRRATRDGAIAITPKAGAASKTPKPKSRAKATKAKPRGQALPAGEADGVASRLSAGRTAQGAAAQVASPALTAKGTPRQRAPKGTFDRKAWQADAARKRRAKLKAQKESVK